MTDPLVVDNAADIDINSGDLDTGHRLDGVSQRILNGVGNFNNAVAVFDSDIAAEFFNVEAIKGIFDDYVGGNSDNWRKVWTIYTFLVWYEEYFVKR